MKRTTRAFLQIVPVRNNNGTVRDVRITKATQTYPRVPDEGALVAELKVVIDDVIFTAPTITVELEGDVATATAAVTPVPVVELEAEDEDDSEH